MIEILKFANSSFFCFVSVLQISSFVPNKMPKAEKNLYDVNTKCQTFLQDREFIYLSIKSTHADFQISPSNIRPEPIKKRFDGI